MLLQFMFIFIAKIISYMQFYTYIFSYNMSFPFLLKIYSITFFYTA